MVSAQDHACYKIMHVFESDGNFLQSFWHVIASYKYWTVTGKLLKCDWKVVWKSDFKACWQWQVIVRCLIKRLHNLNNIVIAKLSNVSAIYILGIDCQVFDKADLLYNFTTNLTNSSDCKYCTSSQAPSYASPKLQLTKSLTGVKCRATSVAKNQLCLRG